MKKVSILILMLLSVCRMSFSQQITGTDLSMDRSVGGISSGTFVRITFSFPTTTPDGRDTTLTGAIAMNSDVYDKTTTAKGLILNHQYTIMRYNECPSRTSSMQVESLLLSDAFLIGKGTGSNYIIVSPDNYGFGGDDVEMQAYLYGDFTARGSLDCLRAAKTVLASEGYEYGDILASVGYSQGGHSSMATMKRVDTTGEYPDLKFNYFCCGGGPHDLDAIYKMYVADGATTTSPVVIPLIYSNITKMERLTGNEIFEKYSDMDLYPSPICDSVAIWYNGKYSMGNINSRLLNICGGGSSVDVARVVNPDVIDSTKVLSCDYREILLQNSLNRDWTPDTSNHVYLFHYSEDEVVPPVCTANMAEFLRQKGFDDDHLTFLDYDPSVFMKMLMSHAYAAAIFVDGVAGILNGLTPSSDGIHNIGVSEKSVSDDRIFDLYGRRLNAIPEKGIYIRGGKKFLVK